ncbi:hypothetical protein MAPG_06022 [Magnaporthiopsis poae ATCC 64411]|uniref:Uncharacterized protein n=1 Tax=Magnaporthiopsis poae (strain ATCC 64411 / 73-15) TaxID=644358 RepID=A0A0C4E0Y0_MAGP6|nr:hypothetical protein MAPG_06022 [Magnaporthiopsis poae ATCC 64411]
MSMTICTSCGGKGKTICPRCGGTGSDPFMEAAVCHICDMTGHLECNPCHGKGERVVRPAAIKEPEGIQEKMPEDDAGQPAAAADENTPLSENQAADKSPAGGKSPEPAAAAANEGQEQQPEPGREDAKREVTPGIPPWF